MGVAGIQNDRYSACGLGAGRASPDSGTGKSRVFFQRKSVSVGAGEKYWARVEHLFQILFIELGKSQTFF